MVPFPRPRRAARGQATFIYRAYHQPRTFTDWSHSGQSLGFILCCIFGPTQCLVHSRSHNQEPITKVSPLARGQAESLGQETVYLALISAGCSSVHSCGHATILKYTFPLGWATVPVRSVHRSETTKFWKTLLGRSLPLSSGSLNSDMPFYNLITTGAVTPYTL